MLKLRSFIAKTNQGPILQNNEDDIEVDLSNKIYMVIDGFGGSGVGDHVARLVKSTVKDFYSRTSLDGEATMPFFYSPKYLTECNVLINGLHLAHQKVLQFNEPQEMHNKGGASLIAIAQSQNLLCTIGIGNCMCLLYSKGQLRQVISPDCLIDLSRDVGMAPFYTCPMSGIGLFNDLHLQVREIRPAKGDLVLMMSDGCYAHLDQQEIKFYLDKSDWTHQQIVSEMHQLANSRGNADNQSTVLLEF